MIPNINDQDTVIGIDVGGVRKGFHAVALNNARILDKVTSPDPLLIINWCFQYQPKVIAVDAPCGWSRDGYSRQAERDLAKLGIHSFFTPTHEKASQSKFYDWVFNAQRLFSELSKTHFLFQENNTQTPIVFETFPHAVVCAVRGEIVSASPKVAIRRKILQDLNMVGLEQLKNIDFVDAALCALAAEYFINGSYKALGNDEEGYIVIPD